MQDILDAGLYSTLAVPTSSDDKPIAWFAINATADTVYTYEDGILAERIVTQSAGVVANALLRLSFSKTSPSASRSPKLAVWLAHLLSLMTCTRH